MVAKVEGVKGLPSYRKRSSPRVRARRLDEGPIQRTYRRAAEQPHRTDHVGSKNLDRARDTGSAGGAERPCVGAAHEHRARAEADGLDDVGAATDAAIHQHFD